jgi:hypothetical protein
MDEECERKIRRPICSVISVAFVAEERKGISKSKTTTAIQEESLAITYRYVRFQRSSLIAEHFPVLG